MTRTDPSPPLPRQLGRAAALLALLLLGGCSILPEVQHYTAYRLPPLQAEPKPPAASWTLRIAPPASSELLAGSRLPVRLEAHRMSVYSGARWVAPLPELWQGHLIEAYRSDGRVAQVTDTPEPADADLVLHTTLRAFRVLTPETEPRARVAVDARLVAPRQQRLLGAERFRAAAPAAGRDADAVVAALGTAGNEVTRALIGWTLDTAPAGGEAPRAGDQQP